jgi:hypothetical protein
MVGSVKEAAGNAGMILPMHRRAAANASAKMFLGEWYRGD